MNIGRFTGTHQQVGIKIGQALKQELKSNIDHYINQVKETFGLDHQKLNDHAMTWFHQLPMDYQIEIQGIAEGSDLPIETLAKWYYSDYCTPGGCTSFITMIDDDVWIGRNNDYLQTNLWDYTSIIEVEGKLPIMLFGLAGSSFSGTGYNQSKLWIHYNFLPVWDLPQQSKNVMPAFVWIRKALESCTSIEEVEDLLHSTNRDGGMNLFLVDGKTNEYAVYECSCQAFHKRKVKPVMVGANHYHEMKIPKGVSSPGSIKRQQRVEELIHLNQPNSLEDLIHILSDEQVEVRTPGYGTVYANVACPATDFICFAADAYPAASKGNFKQINWE